MEDCLHTSSENLSKLVSWAHSHGTICSLIPNLKHLLSEGSHGNLTAMWGCSAGHAYHWPLTATCRAGSQERVCFQDNRSFNSDSPSIIGVPSETQTSPVERYPGRPVKAKLDCNRTRDSCDFSYCSEPSELDEAVEEYEDENTLFDMVCESSVTDEDSDFEPQTQRPQSITRKRPGGIPSSLHSSSQVHMVDECSNDVIIKKIKQEIPEDYYIVANAELTGGVDGPALSLTQMAKPKSQTHAGPSCLGPTKLIPHVTSAISTELDPHSVSASPSVISRPVVQKTARVSLASPNRGPPGAHGTNQQVAIQMPVSTSHPNKQISIPLSALQLPGQDEQIASEEFLPHLPSQVSSCEVALSPSVNTEPEVSSSQQQPPLAPTITTEATAQCIPAYSTKLNKFPVFNINDDLNDLCTSAVSPNTTKATRYALNVWRYWCMTNGLKDHTDITKIPAVKLNELLENFYVTVKKSDGSDFLATSLHAIRRGLDRILKNAGVGFSITSSTFSSSTKKLKEKLWVLSKAGMSGARSRNIIYFSLSDEEEMWQAGCLGDDSPITLLSTVVKYNSQYLNMRTLQEHADLMYGDIELLKDPQNQPYFARTDSVKRESRSGSTRVCHGKIYHEHSRGHKQCPYCLLYKYMYIHRPPTQMEAKSPFYLTARKEATDMDSVWYEEQRMGLRSLRGIVPNLAKKVKLENCENFTFVSFTQVSRRLGSHSCCQ
ncbi:sorting nexin-30 isoform X3 [Dasypus novemcinctus]|uniref:sorting nexin-30 isoform X3 n=1 Tax=Dasypus novemcinctus TaxID=9361 RepID=UPI00265ED7F8|nr:sorting nexin-30 isoform X3 [Dasypus novemcinctus]